MEPNPQLNVFLSAYPDSIQELFIDLRTFVLENSPACNELIWDNYNALALAYSHSDKLKDAFCHLSIYSKTVNFGFNRGAELTKGIVKLEGSGKLIRHLKVKDMAAFPSVEMKALLTEAALLAKSLNPALEDNRQLGQSIVMSISAKKRR